MANGTHPTPRNYKGVMVSSTFMDLERHRAELMNALRKEKLFAIGMEEYVAVPGDDEISSSLTMVQEGSAYIGLIGHRYGQVKENDSRNPHGYSVSRLEFEEAQSLGRPTLIFIMGDGHSGTRGDFETDPEKLTKLDAYRERAKAGRIYSVFNSLEDFIREAGPAVASLRRYLEAQDNSAVQPEPTPILPPAPPQPKADPIPTPPDFYAEPSYIGSHTFVGREAQLDTLNDWASPADPHPLLLFEAIGGTGKSMLTWEWTTKHATNTRQDWAGRFWYSFYERGAIMADFCRRALAYITGQPLDDFRKQKTAELGDRLLRHLQARPWLLILDGLERVLVAYHRFDAAQLADEEANHLTDQIARRDPCVAIRPEDDDLIRALAAAAPSKLLLTTRLTPRVLLNPANLPIPGVRREPLPGLRPADAEALFRACGISGTSQNIQNYLKRHCDCHPLVTGVLAGLINNYLPDRGNFDTWAAAADGGGQLNLASLDLAQKRNHILYAALAALPEKSRQLLSTLALLSEAVDYPTLSAISLFTPQDLAEVVPDLERRGLLQYDAQTRRYDLHPVVRGVAAGGLRQEEKEHYGQRVVDHFAQQAHNPYEEVETFDDVRNGLHIVRTLLQMGRYQQACRVYQGDLADALLFNLEAHAETLPLLRPFFPHGWAVLLDGVFEKSGAYLAIIAGLALLRSAELEAARTVSGAALVVNLRLKDWTSARLSLSTIAETLSEQNRLVQEERYWLFALELAELSGSTENIFHARQFRFRQLAAIGQWQEAEVMWRLLDPMDRPWSRSIYRPGTAEYHYALFRFWQGELQEMQLVQAEQLATAGKNRHRIRDLSRLRGEWQLEQRQWALATESLQEAVRMAREVGQTDTAAETLLALAKFQIGQLPDPRHEAEQLAKVKKPVHRALAELWLALGDREQAEVHALAAYTWAWADGEPYVWRYELNKARALLGQLGADIPNLPPYDPAKDEKLPWEDEVAAVIEKLRAEKEAERATKEAKKKQ